MNADVAVRPAALSSLDPSVFGYRQTRGGSQPSTPPSHIDLRPSGAQDPSVPGPMTRSLSSGSLSAYNAPIVSAAANGVASDRRPHTADVVNDQATDEKLDINPEDMLRDAALLRLRDEHSIRRDTLTREQQKVIHSHEKEEAHWTKQDERFKKMVDRLNGATKTCDELHGFLQRGTKIMGAYSQSLLTQGSFGSQETGTLRQACISFDLLRNSIVEHHTEMKDRVFADSIKQSLSLAGVMRKRMAVMQEAGAKNSRLIKLRREKVAEAWQAYEKAVADRHKAQIAEKAVKQDPLLACRVYDKEMSEMRAVEKEYSKEMNKLFMELRIDDGRRIDATKAILLDYLLAQKALLEHCVKFTESAIASVKAIDRESDVNEFVSHADLLLHVQRVDGTAGMSPASSQVTTIFELPPPNRDPRTLTRLYSQELEKGGTLYRQGKIFKSNWKPVYAAVSTSGFLHYFDDASSSTPDVSINLGECDVMQSLSERASFDVVEPNKSFFSFSSAPTVYVFKAEDETQTEAWMTVLRKFAKRPSQTIERAPQENAVASGPAASEALQPPQPPNVDSAGANPVVLTSASPVLRDPPVT